MTELTAIVLTRNESEMLPGCLESLDWLGCPILVLDSGSEDGTTSIAELAGATVATRAFDGFANQRNAGLAMVDSPWVLFVDADERITPQLARAIIDATDHASDDVAAFQIPRVNLALGRALKGGGWWPDYQTRLLRRGQAEYDKNQQVHEVVKLDGVAPALTYPLVHLNYRNRRQFLRKQRRYTDLRIEHASNVERPRSRHLLGAPARELFRRYVSYGGYRDGLDGLFMASVLAFEEARFVWHMKRPATR